ncbi:MAG: hypothetical protein JNN00_02285 [Chitinophagaceae bacterium]|nr:hypothetical protein [Chitinophagaceae bacterium]
MAQRVFGFVVVFIMVLGGKIFSQEARGEKPGSFSLTDYSFAGTIHYRTCFKRIGLNTHLKSAICYDSLNGRTTFTLAKPFPASFYIQNLGFFCKQELNIEKVTSVPFRFRIGSLDYVDYLEQKPNTKRLQ